MTTSTYLLVGLHRASTLFSAMTLVGLLAGCPSSGDDTTTGSTTTGAPQTTSSGLTDESPTGSEGGSEASETTTSSTSTTEAITTGEPETGTSTTGEPGTTTTEGSSSSSAPMPTCGDGIRDMDEACDDGNVVKGDGCTPACVKECAALRFAGTNFAAAADPATLSVTSVTLAVWHKAKADAPFANLASKQGQVFGGHITYTVTAGATGLGARLQTGLDDFLDLKAPAIKPDETWHHVAVTYDAATGTGVLYYDGLSVDTATKGDGLVAADPTLPFSIGATTHNGGFEFPVKGDVANVVIYDHALSEVQVQGLVTGVYPADPIALWLTAEGMGTMSVDESGQGHDLTVPEGGWVADGPFCAP
jgi:cysteine-rich repeat protein